MKLRIVLLAAVIFIGAQSVMPAYAASVTIPTMAGAKRVLDNTQIGANKFKPAQCAGVTLTSVIVVTGGGATGTNANELMIGNGSRDQVLNGGAGNDCILGGGASSSIDNTLTGGNGNDVMIGGKFAKNTYNGGGNTDTCYYRSGDTVPSSGNCETRIAMP